MLPVGIGGGPMGVDFSGDCSSTAALLSSRTAAAEARAVRSHSEAERRRRQRINGHLATLRGLLPCAARVYTLAGLGRLY